MEQINLKRREIWASWNKVKSGDVRQFKTEDTLFVIVRHCSSLFVIIRQHCSSGADVPVFVCISSFKMD